MTVRAISLKMAIQNKIYLCLSSLLPSPHLSWVVRKVYVLEMSFLLFLCLDDMHCCSVFGIRSNLALIFLTSWVGIWSGIKCWPRVRAPRTSSSWQKCPADRADTSLGKGCSGCWVRYWLSQNHCISRSGFGYCSRWRIPKWKFSPNTVMWIFTPKPRQ